MSLTPIDGSSVTRWADVLVPARQIAEVIAATEFVPRAMRDRADVVTACIMYGDEIGVGPMQALQSIHVVEGRPAPSAELMRAMILRAGHSIGIHEMSGTRCRVSGLRTGRPEGERVVVEWTLDMARAAGLLGRPVWQRYPRAMLLARATSDLARIVFPDVVKGLGYIAETDAQATELEGWAPFDPAPPKEPEKPVRAPVQRRTTPKVRELDTPATPEPQGNYAMTNEPWSDPIDQPVPSRPSGRHVGPDTDATPPDQTPVQEATSAARPAAEAAAPPLPNLAPEDPPEEPVKGPVPIGEGIRKGLLATWRRVSPKEPNAELNRMRRLEAWSDVIGRPLESSKDLTRQEGWTLAQTLGRIEDGDALINETPEGWLRIVDWPDIPLTEPPDDELPL